MDLPIWERKVVEGILSDVREELLWPSLLDTVGLCLQRPLGKHLLVGSPGQLKTNVFCNT